MNDANREEARLVAHEEARLEARAELRAQLAGVRAEYRVEDDGAFERLYAEAFERHYVTEFARLGWAAP